MNHARLSSLTDNELDAQIVALVKDRWQKVAKVIVGVTKTDDPGDEERIQLRIVALVEVGRLESAGDLSKPGYGEIRVPVAGVAGQFGKGIEAFGRQDYLTALKIFEPLAEGGESGASWRIGEMYAKGLGLHRDIAKAKKWYRQALKQGFLPAKESLEEVQRVGRRRS